MTPEESIKIAIHCLGVQTDQEVCEECSVYPEGGIACREVARVAISALEEIQQYREIGASPERLKELIFEGSAAKRILRHYQEIGTVEECREAREKQKPKKCVIDSCPDHTHYKCPSCGKIQKTKYDDSTFGCILNNCSNCGQAIEQGRADNETD